MKTPHTPKSRIRMGEEVDLVHISTVCEQFGISIYFARRWLEALGVPVFALHRSYYFNYATLRRAIYLVTQLGAPGFLTVGSEAKKERKDSDKDALTEITPEVLERLMQLDPDWEIRRAVRESLLPNVLEHVLKKVHATSKASPTLRLLSRLQQEKSRLEHKKSAESNKPSGKIEE